MHSKQRRAWLKRAGQGVAAAGLIAAGGYALSQGAPKVVRISSKKFEFMPAEITLKKGEPVILELVATDENMGIKCPGLALQAEMVVGKVNQVPFTPGKTGQFAFHCDVFCGDGHESMEGVITVVDA